MAVRRVGIVRTRRSPKPSHGLPVGEVLRRQRVGDEAVEGLFQRRVQRHVAFGHAHQSRPLGVTQQFPDMASGAGLDAR